MMGVGSAVKTITTTIITGNYHPGQDHYLLFFLYFFLL